MGEFVKQVSLSTYDIVIDGLLMWLPDEKKRWRMGCLADAQHEVSRITNWEVKLE